MSQGGSCSGRRWLSRGMSLIDDRTQSQETLTDLYTLRKEQEGGPFRLRLMPVRSEEKQVRSHDLNRT